MIISPNNIEKWCFDYFEGNLTVAEKIAFEKYILEHPEFHAEFEAWKEMHSETDDEEIPLFGLAEGLIVGAPFYATFAFRMSAAALLLISLIATGVYLSRNIDGDYEPASLGGVELNWNPNHYALALVRFSDYAYGEYKVGEQKQNQTQGHSSFTSSESNHAFLSSGQDNSSDQMLEINEVDPLDLSLNHENAAELILASESKVTFMDLDVADDNIAPQAEFIVEVQEDEETLYDHLGMKEKYEFLNFTNDKVKGIGVSHKLKKPKHQTNDNHAMISQSADKSGSKNKKKNFFQGLKSIELGLSNINDPIFVVPNSNVVMMNPALAGQLGVTRFKGNLRNQWWNTDASLFTGSIVADTYFEKLQAGAGIGANYVLLPNGKADYQSYTFTYAQKFNVSKNSNVSVAATYDLNKVKAGQSGSEYHEIFKGNVVSQSTLNYHNKDWNSNLGVSSWYSGKYFYGGLNVTNLLGNTFIATHESNTSYASHLDYSVQLGADYKKSFFSNTVLSPFLVYQKTGNQRDLWLGSTMRYRSLVIGAGVASSKSLKGLIGVQGNKMRLTLGTDYMKSEVLGGYAFSHEVSFRILFGTKQNNWSRYEH